MTGSGDVGKQVSCDWVWDVGKQVSCDSNDVGKLVNCDSDVCDSGADVIGILPT